MANTEVRQDAADRYCLNDLHHAAGGEKRHAPNEFFRLGTTADLVEELTGDSRFGPIRSARGGSKPGTYACKELVYAYAMWISPAFHLKVIRAYDTLQTQGVAVAENAAEDFLQNPLDYFGSCWNRTNDSPFLWFWPYPCPPVVFLTTHCKPPNAPLIGF